jgi:L-amino acid N-acyltransferase YncA
VRAGSEEIKSDWQRWTPAIYNQGIEDRIATFETEPRTPDQIAKQLSEKGDRFPTVVAEVNAPHPAGLMTRAAWRTVNRGSSPARPRSRNSALVPNWCG